MKKSKWQEFKDLISGWKIGSWDWRKRNIENLVDDPIDDIKHKLNGIKFCGHVFYLPTCLMKNRNDKDK